MHPDLCWVKICFLNAKEDLYKNIHRNIIHGNKEMKFLYPGRDNMECGLFGGEEE